LISRRAPVDVSKVEALRAAIQSGLYPVEPDRIAQRMLDADLPRRG
jgi:negative regulator of flagellin synthesis FlgM